MSNQRKEERKREIEALQAAGNLAFRQGRSRTVPREHQGTMNDTHWLYGYDEASRAAEDLEAEQSDRAFTRDVDDFMTTLYLAVSTHPVSEERWKEATEKLNDLLRRRAP
jgi:hypothetical protein